MKLFPFILHLLLHLEGVHRLRVPILDHGSQIDGYGFVLEFGFRGFEDFGIQRGRESQAGDVETGEEHVWAFAFGDAQQLDAERVTGAGIEVDSGCAGHVKEIESLVP